ncbi:hypothetical protein LKL91_26095 [Bacillus cereus]|nr:hypothetical protein [Bacillus cereus]
MRQGELLGFWWKGVDLEMRHLTISQTLSHDAKTFLIGRKTKSSLRKVLLSISTNNKAKEAKSS